MSTVLIVDDSATIRRMIRVSLSALPRIAFAEAATGLQGLESLVVSPVDLMVLDLHMPDMHGIDVLRFVRRQEAYKALPIIVLTTRGDAGSRQAALEAGATVFMTKPFSPQALADQAGALLGSCRPDLETEGRAGESR